jgi:hypothetical protein
MGKKLLRMPAEIKIIPRAGKKPFIWKGPEFDMSMRRSMVSDDLESSLGMMEVVTPPGPVGLTDSKGRDLPCSGVITFGVEIAGRPTTVTAWVSTAIRNKIIIGSDTFQELGFSEVEAIPQ